MKNLIHSAYSIVGGVSLVLAAGATTVSCSDFLEVPLESTVATSNFYKTAEEFDLGNYAINVSGDSASNVVHLLKHYYKNVRCA